MANEIDLFRDEKGVAVVNPNGLDEVTKRLLGRSSYKRISIRGKKFRMIVNGGEAARAPGDTMDVVIVNAAEFVGRHFYAKNYDPNVVGIPDCWSNDGVRPDPKAAAPQGKSCDLCPKNVGGSGANGKGRACKYSRRLAVVLANDVENSDVYQIQLPSTSIFGKAQNGNMPLDAYVQQLAGFNYPITGVVTELAFDGDSDAPKLFFRAVRRLTADEARIAAIKGSSAEAEAAITFNPSQMDSGKKKEEPVPAPPAPVEPNPVFREEEDPEPTLRQSKPKEAAPKAAVDVNTLLDDWADETDD